MYGKSLTVRKKALGSVHPEMTASLNNLAEGVEVQGGAWVPHALGRNEHNDDMLQTCH